MNTIRIATRSMYYGTVVALITTVNPDGSSNLAPISSVWSRSGYLVLGVGCASQTAANLRERRHLSVNLPSAGMWRHVEALSGLTGREAIPGHKLSQFRFHADKFQAAALAPEPAIFERPANVRGCPLQIEATVESVREIADQDENFLIVLARTDSVLAEEGILNHHRTAVSPRTWDPLIFSYRTYRSLGREAHRTGLNASGNDDT